MIKNFIINEVLFQTGAWAGPPLGLCRMLVNAEGPASVRNPASDVQVAHGEGDPIQLLAWDNKSET